MKVVKRKFFGLDVDDNRTPVVLIKIVVILWLFAWIGALLYKDSWTERGQFGDMFGAVNALFSGLAFAGIIYTIMLQREELKAQRKELRLNREELRMTREEFTKQSETFTKDQFENTFFSLIDMHEAVRDKLVYRSANVSIDSTINYYNDIRDNIGKDSDKVLAATKLRNIYVAYESSFSSYFNSIKTIIKFVDKGAVKDKQFYYSILYDQFSEIDKQVLYYHAALSSDRELRQEYRRAEYFKLMKDAYLLSSFHVNFINDFREPDNS